MENNHVHPTIQKIINLTNQDPANCYQCGKCSAGCPVRDYFDDAPNRVIRYVQLGLYDRALKSKAIWLCAGCQTCSSRCPQNFEPAKFMDALREIAAEEGIAPSDKNVKKFHKAFLNQIKNNGRSFELGLIRDYKLATGKLFQDIDAAPTAILKGKIGFTPHKIKDTKKIKSIIDKAVKGNTK